MGRIQNPGEVTMRLWSQALSRERRLGHLPPSLQESLSGAPNFLEHVGWQGLRGTQATSQFSGVGGLGE